MTGKAEPQFYAQTTHFRTYDLGNISILLSFVFAGLCYPCLAFASDRHFRPRLGSSYGALEIGQ